MAAVADAENDGDATNVVRLAEVVVRGASDLVLNLIRTSAELSEHDAVPFVGAAGCIVRLVIQQAEAVGENDEYVLEASRRAVAVQSVVDSLQQAEFPTSSPSFVNILDTLAQVRASAIACVPIRLFAPSLPHSPPFPHLLRHVCLAVHPDQRVR